MGQDCLTENSAFGRLSRVVRQAFLAIGSGRYPVSGPDVITIVNGEVVRTSPFDIVKLMDLEDVKYQLFFLLEHRYYSCHHSKGGEHQGTTQHNLLLMNV